MIRRIAIIAGAIFVVVGILGFIPGVTVFSAGTDAGRMFGILAVDNLHNAVHILSGVAALAAGLTGELASRMYFRVFGVVYGVVALLGFAYGSAPLLGVMANNLPDAAVHALIAAAALFLGFGHLPEHFEHPGDTGTHHPA